MPTLTLASAPDTGVSAVTSLDWATGRADAYDDHATLTLDELAVRAAYIADLHPSLAYAEGYIAYLQGEQLSQHLISGRTPGRDLPRAAR
ncbi:hypothetical protein AB0933_32630 [Streptomyces venezuelae]|uniref:hypothetical protein n=1 Tax=Streptomyces venezuelae TaxID=54571 RepID=UPI003453DCA1